MRRDYNRFRDAGGEVAAITMGTPEQAAAFRDRHKLPFHCLSDPQRVAYEAFGIGRATIRQVAGPLVWLRSAWALVRHGGGAPIGDPLQLHAAFIVDCSGVIRFARYPRHSADLPAHDEMIATIHQSGTAQNKAANS